VAEQQNARFEDLIGTDINFDCPHCGKNLEIDARGAGLMITCPDCGQTIQVPDPNEAEIEAVVETPTATLPPPGLEDLQRQIKGLNDAMAASQEKIERLVESLEEVRERRSYLEKLRTENLSRFDRLSAEMGVIQSAIDRIVEILQDARADKISGE